MSCTSSRPNSEPPQTEQLLQQLADGQDEALDQLLEGHRDYLRRLLDVQMDAELRSRVDPSDVIQETQLTVSHRINEFLDARPTSFKLWLRGKALDRLIDARRKHVVARKRSVRREIAMAEASSMALAQAVLAQPPSAAARRHELVQQVNQAVDQLSKSDRTVLLLRHVEELSNSEVAQVLQVTPKAASHRFGRALLKLRAILVRTGAWSAE